MILGWNRKYIYHYAFVTNRNKDCVSFVDKQSFIVDVTNRITEMVSIMF